MMLCSGFKSPVVVCSTESQEQFTNKLMEVFSHDTPNRTPLYVMVYRSSLPPWPCWRVLMSNGYRLVAQIGTTPFVLNPTILAANLIENETYSLGFLGTSYRSSIYLKDSLAVT